MQDLHLIVDFLCYQHVVFYIDNSTIILDMSTSLTCSGCGEKIPDYIFLFSKPWCGFVCANKAKTSRLHIPKPTRINPTFARATALSK